MKHLFPFVRKTHLLRKFNTSKLYPLQKQFALICFSLLSTIQLQAQESVNAAGSNVANNTGSLSYSIGQVFYLQTESASGKLSQGVQQSQQSLPVNLCSNDTINTLQGFSLKGVETSLVYYSNLYLLADNNGNPGFFKYKPDSKLLSNLASNFTHRTQCGLAEYKGKIYCMGGQTNTNTGGNLCEAYDIASNTWQQLGNMPVALTTCKSFTLGNAIYVLGNTSNGNSYFYQYNPLSNVYTALSLPIQNRSNAAFTTYQNKLYILGGTAAGTSLNNADVYDPASNTWSSIAYLPQALNSAGAAIYDNKLYVFGGASNNSTYSQNIYVYDFTSAQWSQSAYSAPQVLSPESFLLNEVVYLLGGTLFNGTTVNVQSKYYCKDILCQCMW